MITWEQVCEKAKGKTIKDICLTANNIIILYFTDDTELRLSDAGQDCCEKRYITCDDDLTHFLDEQLLDVEVADAPNIDDRDDVHEVQFLRIKTSGGIITFETHNEHNGYYGGFCIVAE